jgi:hypothetical protein
MMGWDILCSVFPVDFNDNDAIFCWNYRIISTSFTTFDWPIWASL